MDRTNISLYTSMLYQICRDMLLKVAQFPSGIGFMNDDNNYQFSYELVKKSKCLQQDISNGIARPLILTLDVQDFERNSNQVITNNFRYQ